MHEKDDMNLIGLIYGCDIEISDLKEQQNGEKEK